jgi:hypothetical protein
VCRASANLPDFFSVQKLGRVWITHQEPAEALTFRIVVTDVMPGLVAHDTRVTSCTAPDEVSVLLL